DAERAHALLVSISSSGTLVNGQPVTQHELDVGDVIKVGNTELRLRNAEAAEASTVHDKVGGPAKPKLAAAVPSAAALTGQTLSNYQLETIVAKGATGVVYKAKDTATGQTVALKVLKPEFAANEEEMQRFVRGMKVALPLRHPNLIALHKAGKT